MTLPIEIPVIYAFAVPNGTTQVYRREGSMFIDANFEMYHISVSQVLKSESRNYTDVVANTGQFCLEGYYKDIKEIIQEAMIKAKT